MGTQRGKLLTLLVAVVVLVAACAGSDDSEEATDAVAVETDQLTAADGNTEEAGRATSAGSDEAAGAMDDDAMDDEAMEEEAMEEESEDAAAPVSGAERSGEIEGGFFAPEPAPDAEDDSTANFADYGVRPFVDTERDPLSTFALDVDTASYSVARQWLESGSMPPPEAVRVEEFVNSFDYDYEAPGEGLAVQADAGPSPFDPGNVILRLGVQAERVANIDRPAASLTFVVDTSGSMDRVDRLGLVKTSLSRLVGELNDDDTVAIVTYSDGATVILDPTPVERRAEILDAIDRLRPTGRPTSRPDSTRATTWRPRPTVPTGSTASCWPPTASPTSGSATPTA